MRTVALDVHKRFAEVAVHENGGLKRLGRIETGQLRAFADSLGPEDHVVLESTAMTWAIAELLSEHAGRVTVSNPMRTRAIASAKVKTDKSAWAAAHPGAMKCFVVTRRARSPCR